MVGGSAASFLGLIVMSITISKIFTIKMCILFTSEWPKVTYNYTKGSPYVTSYLMTQVLYHICHHL